MPTAPTAVTTAPTAPDRADRATFSSRATAWADYQKDNLVPEINALATNVYNNAVEADADATTASTKATEAAASAAAAAATAGATKWISGTTYAEGDVVWSPINSLSYRRISAGGGTTDPSIDSANWASLASSPIGSTLYLAQFSAI